MVSQFILDFLHPLIFIEFKVIRIFAYILLVNTIGQFSTSLNLLCSNLNEIQMYDGLPLISYLS